MISIQAFCVNVTKVGEIFMRHGINAKVSTNEIIVYAEHIPKEVLSELLKTARVTSVSNFQQQPKEDPKEPLPCTKPQVESCAEVKVVKKDPIGKVTEEAGSEEPKQRKTENQEETVTDEEQYAPPMEVVREDVKEKAALIASVQEAREHRFERWLRGRDMPDRLMRGQVYKWGEIEGYDDEREGSIKRCVIIVQNDYDNTTSDDTIALLCTSEYEKRSQVHCNFQLIPGNMEDFDQFRLKYFAHCTLFSSRIIGINRSQLGRYLGTLNVGFMNRLQSSIDYCLGLKRSKDVNWAQLDMLSRVNVGKLFEIAKSNLTDEEKVKEFMILFGFDRTKNGVSYVEKAILKAVKLTDYRIEHLATLISDEEDVDEREIQRLMIARIKENFQVRFSPAISFIRLIVCLLKKG